jgi:hypothetical protein
MLVLTSEKSRWLALTFPGVTAVVAYWLLDETPAGSSLEQWLFAGAVIMLIFSLISLLVYRSEAGVWARYLAIILDRRISARRLPPCERQSG